MKNIIPGTIVLLFVLAIPAAGQQVQSLWSQSMPDGVTWQMVTPYGNFIVGTPRGLAGINPDNGAVLWKNSEMGEISADNIGQAGASALLKVNAGSAIYFLDPFSGQVKFDSRQAGVSEIKDQQVLYQANGILVSGKTADNKDLLLMTSMSDGKIAWKIDDDFGRFIIANEISANELLIVTLFYNYKVNPATGEVIWKNDVSQANQQIQKMGALGNLMKQAASNMAQEVNFNVRFYRHPTKPVFYLASEQEGKAATTGFSSSTTTGNGPSYHTTYSAFDMNDGKRIWPKELDVSGKIGGVYFDEKGLVIMPDDGSNTKVNCYDYASHEGLWGKKGRGLNIKGGVYTFNKVKDGLVIVSQNTSGKNFISYLSLTTAELTFDKPVQIDGRLVWSEITPRGLIYLTSEELNILDITTGELLLNKGIKTSPALTALKDDIIYALDNKQQTVVSLNKNTGELKTVSGEIKFDGKELPTHIEIRANGLLVSSSQNIMLIGYDGKEVFKKYFEAPREPGIVRALRYAEAVRAAYIGAAAYTASAAFQSAGAQEKQEDQATGVLLDGIGSAYNELGNAASDFAKKSFQAANARFKATQNANDFVVMLTRQDKDNVLVKVNKNTGAAEGNILLGKDNAPKYAVDAVTGSVFYSPDSKTVVGYRF